MSEIGEAASIYPAVGPMPQSQHEILAVVELLVDPGRWPAGTVGTVVEADDHQALVEISDDRGHALDFVSLPHHALALHHASDHQIAS